MLIKLFIVVLQLSLIAALANTCEITNSNSMVFTKYRSVKKVMQRPRQHWVGDGFHVYPVFADLAFTQDLSPLLMFDYGSPKEFPPRSGKSPLGVGQHPHRGFETVTVAFQGEVEHHDSTGNSGIIHPGDVQWMTAGRGIIHQEYHSKEFTNNGGTLEMCQLWVNLPKKDKMTKPRYQAIRSSKIPEIRLPTNKDNTEGEPLAFVRIIAGEMDGTKGAASTFSPVNVWDIRLPHAGSEVDIPYNSLHQCIVFVRRGSVNVISSRSSDDLESSRLGAQDVAVMHIDGSDTLRLRVNEPNSSVLILGGEPLNEPIAAEGPFVMNTREELLQAISDYRMGKLAR